MDEWGMIVVIMACCIIVLEDEEGSENINNMAAKSDSQNRGLLVKLSCHVSVHFLLFAYDI